MDIIRREEMQEQGSVPGWLARPCMGGWAQGATGQPPPGHVSAGVPTETSQPTKEIVLIGGSRCGKSEHLNLNPQHIWCNMGNLFWPHPENCTMCVDLWADHPYDPTMSEVALMARESFPNRQKGL